jgi:hypothetical protein
MFVHPFVKQFLSIFQKHRKPLLNQLISSIRIYVGLYTYFYLSRDNRTSGRVGHFKNTDFLKFEYLSSG